MSHRLMATLVAAAALSAAGAAHGAILVFEANLSGLNENPVNASPGTGLGVFTIDDVLHTMKVDITFADLIGTTTASHVHCCAPAPTNVGVATELPLFTGFPTGVHAGTYSHVFDLTLPGTFNPAFVTSHGGTAAGAEAGLLAGMAAHQAYLNVHSTFAPGGEIRGQLTFVPEPQAWALMILGFGMAGAALRRRRLAPA